MFMFLLNYNVLGEISHIFSVCMMIDVSRFLAKLLANKWGDFYFEM